MTKFNEIGDGTYFYRGTEARGPVAIRRSHVEFGTRFNCYVPSIAGQGLYPWFEVGPNEPVIVTSKPL